MMGGDGHGHGHEPPYKIPDYRVYKVESVPELVTLRRLLAQDGLKDPWIRNEVWKYRTIASKDVAKGLFGGFKYGLIAAIISSAFTYYFRYKEEQEGHHGKSKH